MVFLLKTAELHNWHLVLERLKQSARKFNQFALMSIDSNQVWFYIKNIVIKHMLFGT